MTLQLLSIFCLISILFCFWECKKDNSQLNITLYDKPLSVIQSSIQGKWKLEYEKGGICSICVSDFHNKNYLRQFTNDNRIVKSNNDTIITDTSINWIYETGTFPYKLTYTINFNDKQNVPWVYNVYGKVNDSLILHDHSDDPVYYHFSKQN